MAFELENVNRTSSGANSNAPAFYAYFSDVDDGAAIATAGYFDDFKTSLRVADSIYAEGTDGPGFLTVLTVSPQVTVGGIAVIAPGGIGTAQIQDQAVTADKIEDDSITDDQVEDNALSSLSLAVDTIQYLKVPMTAAQWNGMYAAPFEILAAPGANKLYVVESVMLEVDYGGAQFAAGGVFGLQYDNTANGAGTGASATSAAAVANAWAADSVLRLAGACPSAAAATTVNKSLCMSNLTGAFTTGSSTVDVHIGYRIVTTTL
jgi:hypothetical protein